MARWQPGSGTAWYLTDRLGTVRDLVDAAGVLINHVDYDSFGQVLAQTNTSAGDRFLFTARELDTATQQYYFRARYYVASIGKFTTSDPTNFNAGDLNLYRYAFNGPTLSVDPTGLASTTEEQLSFLNSQKLLVKGAIKARKAEVRNLTRLLNDKSLLLEEREILDILIRNRQILTGIDKGFLRFLNQLISVVK